MANIKASIQVNNKPLSTNVTIPLLKSAQSGDAYDLFYSVQQLFKGRYILREIELVKRYTDMNKPRVRQDKTSSAFLKTSKSDNLLAESDVRKMNNEMRDSQYRLSVTLYLFVDGDRTMKASAVFDFHRCWTCDAKADLVDKVRMETFCCHECHSLRLSALPTSVTTMPPPNEEDFWHGPYDVYVPRNINDVPARNGRDRRFQRGDETKSSGFADLSEDKWKSKYAYEKNGYWFFRV